MPATLTSEISPSAYRLIADRVYAHSRIRLGTDKQALVTGRLGKRLRQLKLPSFEAYCSYLESTSGHAEIGPLVDLISTNHTHFFREIEHLEFLRHKVLPAVVPSLIAERGTFRFWSAASSSGEEPYSVAIVIAEFARTTRAFQWKVEGSDISTRVLDLARAGIYPSDRLRLPDPSLLSRYFQRGTGENQGLYRVKDCLRQQMVFHHLNLLQAHYPVPPDQHVIFCRNVMIYFDQATQQELIDKLIRQLAPGGYLVVGLSESLIGVNHSLRTAGPGIYQRA